MTIPGSWHFDRETRHRLKRDMLLSVAAQCFNEKGTTGTSLKDVARRLGITDAAVYYYVRNKEELIYLCYSRALDIGAGALDQALLEGDSSLQRIRLYIRRQIEAVCGDAGPVAMLSEIPALATPHREEIVGRSRAHTQRLIGLIQEGVSSGELLTDDPVIACNAILGAVNWIPKWFRPSGAWTGAHIGEVFAETLTSGLMRARNA